MPDDNLAGQASGDSEMNQHQSYLFRDPEILRIHLEIIYK
jgi:hypothetical protein